MEPIDQYSEWLIAALISRYNERGDYWKDCTFVEWIGKNLKTYAQESWCEPDELDKHIESVRNWLFEKPNSATSEVLNDPELMQQLRDSAKDLRDGRTIEWDNIRPSNEGED